jgi:hypothetical protein
MTHTKEPLILRQLTQEENDECSFWVEELPDGLCLTQHRLYRWGDTAIFAVGELNWPNKWDDADFDDTCKRFEAALQAQNAFAGLTPEALAGLIEAADAARCDFPLPHLDTALANIRGEA